MFFYIALVLWAATMVNADFSGATKLALFTGVAGLIVVYLIYFQALGVIGQTLLCALAIIAFLGDKLINIKSK